MAILTKERYTVALASMILAAFYYSAADAAYTPASKPSPAGSATTSNEALAEVTVLGDRDSVKQNVAHFARQITRKRDINESIARWVDPLCPLVAGLPEAPANFMLERIATIAQAAGVKLDGKNCKPNLYVIVTSQPAEFLKAWRRRDGNIFGEAFPNLVNRFTSSTRPISVWYNDAVVGSFDMTPTTVSVLGASLGTGVYQGFKMLGSRAQYDTLVGIRSAIVIVNTVRTAGFEIHPIADYVAMIGLMEMNPDADLGRTPSVLHIFDGGAAEKGLSEWDQSFLKALYQTDPASRSQPAQIAASMMVDLTH